MLTTLEELAGRWIYGMRPHPTWQELAEEVRRTPKRRFRKLWEKRYLPAIQNVGYRDGKMFPGFIAMFSDMANDGDWAQLQDILACSFDATSQLKAPAPKL